MKTKSNWIIKQIILILVLAFLAIISFMFDKQIFSVIQNLRTPLVDSILRPLMFIQKDIILIPIGLVVSTALIIWKKRKNIWPFILSMAVIGILSYLLRLGIARPRPLDPSFRDSFPSGHSSFLFAPVPYLEYKAFRWITIVWIAIAIILAITRVWYGIHYLSDIIAGIVISYTIALIIKVIFEKKIYKNKKLKNSKNKK